MSIAGQFPLVIGLHGARASGKDMIAQHLVEHWGFEAIAFADPIRAALITLAEPLGLTEADFHDRTRKEAPCAALQNVSPRKAMQTLGDWGCETLGLDWWVRHCAASLAMLASLGATRVVITDVRKQIEADFVRALPRAQTWLVQRPGAQMTHDHNSEWELPSSMLDRAILNHGPADYALAQADRLVQELLS
jgi:hypothetical protein